MAIGAGWQAAVAYVNIACYYILGVPLGVIMGYKLDLGVRVSSIFSPSFPIIFLLHLSYLNVLSFLIFREYGME